MCNTHVYNPHYTHFLAKAITNFTYNDWVRNNLSYKNKCSFNLWIQVIIDAISIKFKRQLIPSIDCLDEFQHILNIAKPRIVIVSRHTESLFVKILPKLSWKMELIQLDDQPLTPNIRTLTNILNNEPAVNNMRYKATDIGDASRHPLAILCSSGTTGLPKGVTWSHKNLMTFLTKLR